MDLSLYAIIDDLPTAIACAQGGASIVQLRNKSLNDRELFELAVNIKNVLDEYKIPFLINDRVDISLACDASGVHLGQNDLSPITARRLGGKGFCIGLTIDSEEDLIRANELDIDYVAFGPVFPTATKELTKKTLGLELFSDYRKKTHHKVVAIGGIDDSNAASLISAGADGVAVVSYISKSSNKIQSIQKLNESLNKAKQK